MFIKRDFVQLISGNLIRVKYGDFGIAVLFFLMGIFLKLPFVARFCTYSDGANWSLQLKEFLLFVGIPPGAPLYTILAKLVNYIIGDLRYSFVALSVLFSGLLATGIFYSGKTIFNRKNGIIATLIFLSSPYFWYYGEYVVYFLPIGFFGLMTALFCYKIIVRKEKQCIIGASIFYALMIGLRPQEIISLFPLWLWAIFKSREKSIKGIAIFIATCLIWFIPLTIQTGGFFKYFSSIFDAIFRNNTAGFFLYSLPCNMIKANFTVKCKILFLTYGIGLVPLFYYLYPFFNLKSIFSSIKVRFFLVWILPAAIVYSVILFGDAMGYLIVPFLALLFYLAEAIDGTSHEIVEVFNIFSSRIKISAKKILISFVVVIVSTNSFLFLYDFDPKGKAKDDFEYQSYSNIKKKDKMHKLKFDYIKSNINPRNSLILTRFYYFLPLAYHLPEYRVYSLDSIENIHEGTRMRFGYQHKISYYSGYGNTLIIPKGITKIILFDEDYLQWNKSPKITQIVSLGDLYSLQIVNAKEGQEIRCDFNNFSVISK